MQPGNRRAILAALFANFGVAIAKFVGWAVTGAASMLAEGVHSVADTANQVLLLWGHQAAQREPTRQHAFGFGRERYFWAFVVALVIFSLGSLFAIYEGITKIRHPHELTDPRWAIGILLFAIVLEGFSFRTAVQEARRVKGASSWWEFVRRTKNPELPVVLLEDLGALLGLLIALVGISLAMWTGDPRFDAVGSIAIGVLLGAIAVVLAVEMKSLLIGESAALHHEDVIRRRIESLEPVRRVIHMRTQHIGPDRVLLGAKIDFDATLDFSELTEEIDLIEATIREILPFEVLIYIEPDIYTPHEDSRVDSGVAD